MSITEDLPMSDDSVVSGEEDLMISTAVCTFLYYVCCVKLSSRIIVSLSLLELTLTVFVMM